MAVRDILLPVTIREYIKRRVRLSWALLVLILVTTPIVAVLISTLFVKLDMNWTISIIAPLAMGFTFWRLMHIKCPRCEKNVGLAAAMDQTNECPNCEASFDQPVVLAAGAAPRTSPKYLSIRKYVRQRAGQVQMYLMLAIVLVGIGFISRYEFGKWAPVLLGLITGALAILVSVAVAASTRCPRCATPLGRAGASLMWKRPANNCPTCGINFDEPFPGKLD
jgi:DNA-directed RNA polymerase subunit RPC12/RpoP